jgi:hypothetical protein
LPEIVAAFLETALMGKAADEKRVKEEVARQRAAEERARQAELIRKEEARVRALHRAATNWERARRIRELVAAASEAAQRDGVAAEPGIGYSGRRSRRIASTRSR